MSALPSHAQAPLLPPRNPAPASNWTEATSPIKAASPYILGAGDRIRIDVFGVTQYSGEQLVLADGTINLQGLGNLSVAGLTLPQTQQLISRRYSAILRQPIVTVNLLAPRPIQIGISGEVLRPGSYTLSSGAGQQYPRLSQAIQLAGGISQSADLTLVQLRRADPNQPVINLNLEELLQAGNLSQDPILLDGDSIFIPTLSQFDIAQSWDVASSNLAAQPTRPIQVVVVGEVFRPGTYTVGAANQGTASIPTNSTALPSLPVATQTNIPTVTRAIQIAGGIKNSADIRNVEVRRITKTGLQTTTVNLWELVTSGDIRQDVFLQEGDTIVIPTAEVIDPAELEDLASASFAPVTINVNVVGEVMNPGLIQVAPNTPLNQALLAAGGFDKVRAKQGNVELIRLNPNGTVSRRKIPVDFEQGISSENNPVIQNNDIIVVSRSFITGLADKSSEIFRPTRDFFTLYTFFEAFFGSSGNSNN